MNEYKIGLKLKELRKAGNLTLQQVAEGTTVSVALLSQIENGNVTPSLKTLLKLASYFKISIGKLFEEPAEKPRYTLFRGSGHESAGPDGKTRTSLAGGCSTMVELATRDRMRCYLMDLKTDTSIKMIGSRSAETFLYIIDGKIEIIDNQERCSVETGDGVYLYDAGGISLKPLGCPVARVMRIEAA